MDFRAIGMGLAFALMWVFGLHIGADYRDERSAVNRLGRAIFIAGLVTLAIARALGQSLRLSPSQWRLTILFGICQNALYLGLNFVAMQTIEASLAAIIASSLAALGGAGRMGDLARNPFPRGDSRPAWWLCRCCADYGYTSECGRRSGGRLLCGIGVLALTFATLAVRGASAGGNLLTVVGMQMLVGSVALTAPALTETWAFNWSWPLILAGLYTIFVPGVIATIVWFQLVNRIGTVRAATFHFLNPFLGVAIAALLLGEALGPLDIVGVVIITISIFAVQTSRVTAT